MKRITGFSVPVVGGGLQWKDDPAAGLPQRQEALAKSFREFRPTVQRIDNRVYFGFRIPNATPHPVNVRKVIGWLCCGRNLLNLVKYVQLDGIHAPRAVTDWELPAHLAGLWLIPYQNQSPESLQIKSVEIEHEVTLPDGASHIATVTIDAGEMHEETRAFFSEWAHKLGGGPVLAVTQLRESPTEVDMAMEKQQR